MILFGWRTTVQVVLSLVLGCGRCGRTAAHHLEKRRRWFTLFFVPLVPLSTSYVDTCLTCGFQHAVPKEQAQGALEQHRPQAA